MGQGFAVEVKLPNLPLQLQVNIGRSNNFVNAASSLQAAELPCVPDGDQYKPSGMGRSTVLFIHSFIRF